MTLKPCPFCGNTKAAVMTFGQINGIDPEDDPDSAESFAVCCNVHDKGCGATGGFASDEEEAQQFWEQRT
jgi:Lar family restriction alleviation protein